jgi:hypothetical protein
MALPKAIVNTQRALDTLQIAEFIAQRWLDSERAAPGTAPGRTMTGGD